MGERWGQERKRLLESSAGTRIHTGFQEGPLSKNGAKEGPPKVGSPKPDLLKKGEAPKKEAQAPKKEEAPQKTEAPKKEAHKKEAPGARGAPEGEGAPEEALSAEALARKALVAMPKICEIKAWQEAADLYAGRTIALNPKP